MQAAVSAPAPDDTPDWHLVQSLYLQGKTPKEIEALTGVKAGRVSVWASRKGWTSALSKARQSTKVEVVTRDSSEVESPKLTAQSQRTRTALADVLVRSAEKLASYPINTKATALEVNQEAESLVRNAKTVFGWSEGQSQPSVRINVLSSFSVAPTPESEQGKVIDVTSTPVPLPPSE